MSEPNSLSCHGQLISSSLHRQTGSNTLSGDVFTPMVNHDLVPSLPHNIESQTHSRPSQCDGRPPVQVPPSSVDRMVLTSSGVQANLPKMVHPSCRPICHSSEPQTSSICVSYPRPQAWDIDFLNINCTGLTPYAFPPTALLHRVIQKSDNTIT